MASKKEKTAALVGDLINSGKPAFRAATSEPTSTQSTPSVPNQEIRFTFLADKVQIAKLKAISAQTGMTMKAIMHELLASVIDKYESKHGSIAEAADIKRTSTGLISGLFDN